MTPRTMTLAYRIWAYATPKGWDCSARDIGEALGEPWGRISTLCRHRGWNTRLRQDGSAWGARLPVGADGIKMHPSLNASWIE